MKNCIAVSLLACALSAAGMSAVSAQTVAQPAPIATLDVTGSSTAARAPDRAVISFRIETNDDRSATAMSANATIANALQKRLAAMNIPASAIATSGYGLSFTPHPPKPDPASTQRFGYTVERSIDVTIDAVDGAGAVVDAGVAAGVTNVNGISFVLRDPHAAVRSVQTSAVADAITQAHDLAAAANVRLVRILRITPSGGSAPIRPLARVQFAAAAAAPTTIDPGNLSVTANVTIEYEIAPNRP